MDATRRERRDEALERPEPLERLYAATSALGSAIEDEAALLTRIVHELAALLNTKYAALGILGEDGGLTHFITTGLTDEEESLLRQREEDPGFPLRNGRGAKTRLWAGGTTNPMALTAGRAGSART